MSPCSFQEQKKQFCLASLIIFAVGPKTVRAVVPFFMQSCYHHSISNLRISSYIDRDTQGRYGGAGGVGGWGGIITFGTTYIMSLYHHHHIITQSSCHHHAISNFRKDIPMYIRMWQWRHWHSSQHASLLTLTSKALSKKRNE